MAEFCLDCYNRLYEKNYREDQVELELGLCEGCGEWKTVVAWVGRPSVLRRLAGTLGWYAIRLRRKLDK